MLKKMIVLTAVLGLAWALVAAVPAEAGWGRGKVKGEVVKIEQQQRTGNGGEFTQLTVRTRNGERIRLDLGNAAGCGDCLAVGDQVQARLRGAQGPNGSRQVQSVKVRHNGQMHRWGTDEGGNVVREQGRIRDGSGAGGQGGGQARTRLQDGSNCDARGRGAGQGGGNAGGAGRGGAGGGGRGRG